MANPRTAIIVLNRNLGKETDQLCEFLKADGGDAVEIFVVESGSEPGRRSRYATWIADSPEAIERGLRYARGFNFGLGNLFSAGRLDEFEFIFLVCNDVEFLGPVIGPLIGEMDRHPKLGILSPCEQDWGEQKIMGNRDTVYVWHINHIAWLYRTSMVKQIMNAIEPFDLNFLYDGTNFRGYLSDIELVVKAYANDFAAGLTRVVHFRERVELIRNKAEVMRTDPQDVNLKAVVEEGLSWLKRKYGFRSRWQMQQYARLFYEEFFRLNPSLAAQALFLPGRG
jgi:hypothetical protein